MNARITSQNVQETEPAYFIGDASSVGLKPGEWPTLLETDLGNKLPLTKTWVDRGAGDINSVTYCQQLGVVRVKLFNG